MAKLYFRYASMGAGKSIDLLRVAYNYEERNQRVLLLVPVIDDRYGVGKVTTRIGLQRDACVFDEKMNLFDFVKFYEYTPNCILIDEAQFLTKLQVEQLTDIVDYLDIPVICYGIRTDFRNEVFEGSQRLLALADKLEELKTICDCGKKATQIIKIVDGKVITTGKQIEIGDSQYKAICRKCYKDKVAKEMC